MYSNSYHQGKYLGEDGDKCPVAGAAVICGPWDLLVSYLSEMDLGAMFNFQV